MDSHQLAQELRQRFYSYARGDLLIAVPDNIIIDRSVRCPKCGELYVSKEWVFTAIQLSPTVEEFLNLTDGLRAHLHEYVEDLSYRLLPNDCSHPLELETIWILTVQLTR